jgi:class 3 adenylate cyclase/tetratricopeptide (TPR) repeat protein
MRCPRCQQENPPQAKFCLECATPLALRCTNCGTQLPTGAKFCFECATAVAGPGAAPRFAAPDAYTPKHLAERIINSKAALEGERKHVTVLFADLKGSMELLTNRDAEEARRLLDPVIEYMMEAVHRYEGTVNQVMGDGIMALFGAPVAHEDHAVRACYAALRMQESVKRYAEGVRRQEGITVRIRVGLNSGEVVVRAIGSDLHMDYTAVGQTTHLAARMEQLADPGTVLMTDDTLALAEGFVEVKSLGPMAVKGLTAPVHVHELIGASAVRSRLQAAAVRGLTRFVGRDAEIEHVGRVQRLAGEGRGQLVAVVGEPGVGKSRLVYEFAGSHRVQGWKVLQAPSVSYGKATSYLPVIDLLRSYFKVQGQDGSREVRAKVTGTLLTLDRALEPMLPALLALLDLSVDDPSWLKLDPGQRRRQTHEAVKRLLLRETREQPLLLIFEDLHWIDDETQALLDSLADSLGSVRLLLLVNYRPEYRHTWSGKTFYSQLRLDALPAESTEWLLGALLGDDPGLSQLKQLLVKRGNPFFLEETVRTLVETGVLTGERGRYRLTQPVQALQVPPTVQAVLAARIDRLSPDDKSLLQSAAVVGKDVPFTLLAAIMDGDEQDLRRGLARLEAAEFLYETALFPDLEYTFKHALTHDVTYGMILGRQRRALHLRLFQTLEKLAADRLDEYVERLAHHALQAELWSKAAELLRRAGLRNISRSANREAAAQFQAALTCLERLPDTSERNAQAFDLHLDLVATAIPRRDLDMAAEHRLKAESLAAQLNDPHRTGLIAVSLAMHAWLTGKLREAEEAAGRALGIGTELGDTWLLARAQDNLGRALFSQGDYRQAKEILDRNIAMLTGDLQYERFGAQGFMSVFSRHFAARCSAAVGAFDEGRTCAEQALAIAGDHPHSVLSASSAVAIVARERGEFGIVAATMERALALCESLDVRVWTPILASDLGYAYAYSGRISDALPLLERAASTLGNDGSARLTALSAGYLLAGRLDEARATAGRALALAMEVGELGNEAAARRILGDIASHGARLETAEAVAHYQQALDLAEPRGMRPLVAHCHLGLGKLYHLTGKREQAQEHLSIATAMYREMGMTYWLKKSQLPIEELERLG